MTTQFDNIYHGAGKVLGKIRFSGAGLGWKPLEEGATVTIPAQQATSFTWVRVARNFQLSIALKGIEDEKEDVGRGYRASFENFQRDDYDRLAEALREYFDKPLEAVDVSTRGWNWGEAEVDDHDMKFTVRKKLAFALPLSSIANSNIAGRTEVSMEFLNPQQQQPGQNTGAAKDEHGLPFNGPKRNRPDELVEMRLYIPGEVERDDEEARGDGSEEEEEEEEEESAAVAFHNAIKSKADIGQVAGDGILVLKEVLVLTPRGRYDIELFPQFLRLRGKTYDYKILYSSITHLFLLPKPDDIHVLFVVALEPPIRQGQTLYPYLVLQFPREEEMDAELNLDDETIQTQYEGKLKKRYEEPTFRIVTNLFRVLSEQKVSVPTGFTSSVGQESVRCNVKANDGNLYPLNKSLIWVSKQPVLIPYSDVQQIVFSRVGGAIASAKTFDMRVATRHSGDHTFQSVNREELDSLNNYFAERKLRIKNELMDEGAGLGAGVDELLGDEEGKLAGSDDDDEEDDDFDDESSDDGGSPSEASSNEDDEDGAAYEDEEEKPKLKKLKTYGPTSAGKSTLVENLLAVLQPPASDAEAKASPIASASVLHQDDFCPPTDQMPWSAKHQSDYRRLEQVIRYTMDHGDLPRDFESHEYRRSSYASTMRPAELEAWRTKFHAPRAAPVLVSRDGRKASRVHILIVEGFLTFFDTRVLNLIDVRIFLRVSKATMKQRRENRPDYVLDNGSVWHDPPFYFDEIVWPAYLEAHAAMFENNDVETGAPLTASPADRHDGGPVQHLVVIEGESMAPEAVAHASCEAIWSFGWQ
ncbi:Pob3p [Malassezia vespertilionis]|uniref:Pob3p n=1 Tax=Malassezia vespertilionis TaxID=2020962 RepID=A0A2N1J7T8_9BASI|nr:Pob3p [Malassezia vespertilionis]